MKKIIQLMGASSSGKDTLAKIILEKNEFPLQSVVMYTTRPIRVNEIEGRDYYFVSEKTMKTMEKQNQIVERRSYNTQHGIWHYYTGATAFTEDYYLAVNTLEAYDSYVKYFGTEFILPIYVAVEDGIRLSRALEREIQQQNPKYEELCRRFLADSNDFSKENLKNRNIVHQIDNSGNIEESVEQFCKILSKHL